ncbi:MAG: PKD domain-containing protein [Planctomycetota bacterium]
MHHRLAPVCGLSLLAVLTVFVGCGAQETGPGGLMDLGDAAAAGGEGDLARSSSAAFTASSFAGTAPLGVAFDGSPSVSENGEIAGYAWDFGDGAAADTERAYHTYERPGIYTAQLAVTDTTGGTEVAQADIAVLPAFTIASGPAEEAELAVNFAAVAAQPDAESFAGLEFAWDFGDGAAGQGQEVSHTYAQPGAYVVRLSLVLGALSVVAAEETVDAAEGRIIARVVAHAGENRTASPGQKVELNGSQSRTGGVGGIYRWSQVAGPSVKIVEPSAVQTSFIAPQVSERTELVFELIVSDGRHEDRARVTITIAPSGSGQAGALLTIEPEEPFEARGPVGGPFAPSSKQYTLINSGDAPLQWTAGGAQPWVSVVPAKGEIPAGRSAQVNVTLVEASAGTLADGVHSGTVQFVNATNGAGNAERGATLTIGRAAGDLLVSPPEPFSTAGPERGPFAPISQEYTLTNIGGAVLDWSATGVPDWLAVTPAGGQLGAGQSATVLLALTGSAGSLPTGAHSAAVEFVAGGGRGAAGAPVNLTVTGASMNAASRTQGVVPLAVWFDAVDAGSGIVQPPDGDFASFRYEWDFGDDPTATWGPSGNKRNQATGFVAAHVFENPGLYRVTLTVTTPAGQTYTYYQEIGVLNFCGTTYYVSSSTGNDNNDGLSTARPLQSFAKAMTKVAPNTRILFKRGDTWTVTGQKSMNVRGPGIVGAYGTGNRPFLNATFEGDLFLFSPNRSEDWRIVDIEARAPATNAGGAFISAAGGMQRLTLVNVRIDGFRTAFGNSYADTNSREIALANCEGVNSHATIAFLGGHQLAILGCSMRDCPATHILRIWHGSKSVVSDSECLRAGPTRHALKFHNDKDGHYPPSSFNVVCDNTFLGDTWVVTISPQDAGAYEEVTDMLFERNVVKSSANTQVGIHVVAKRVTLRNNIIDGRGAARYFRGVQVTKGSNNPAPVAVRLLNNTIVRCEESVPPGAEFTGVHIDAPAVNTIVRSNIMYAPPSHDLVADVYNNSSSTVADHNLWRTDPRFRSPATSDFHLLTGSPAIGYGIGCAQVWEDRDRYARPLSGATDAGCYQAGH